MKANLFGVTLLSLLLFDNMSMANANSVGNDLVSTDSGNCLFQNGCPQSLGLLPHIGAENFAATGTVTSLDFTSWVVNGSPSLSGVDWYIFEDSVAGNAW